MSSTTECERRKREIVPVLNQAPDHEKVSCA